MSASRRVSPSERFRARVDELFNSGRELGQILEEVARLGVALLFQVALEADPYRRGKLRLMLRTARSLPPMGFRR